MLRSPSVFELVANMDKEVLTEREQQVFDFIKNSEFVPPNRAKSEVIYFFRGLGVDPYYFQSTSNEQIAEHILALYSAKLLSATSQQGTLSLRLFQEKEDSALYIVPSLSGQPNSPSVKVEHRIESEYLLEGYVNREINKKTGDWEEKLPYEISKDGYRVQVYRTSGEISPSSETKLRLYFVQKANFSHPPPPPPPHFDEESDWSKETSLSLISDQTFFNVSTDNTKRLTEEILKEAVHSLGSITRVVKDHPEGEPQEEVRLIVAYRSQSTHSFFSGMTSLYHSHGLHSTKKYFEPMSNGMRVLTFFLRESPHHPIQDNASLMERARRVEEESSYIYVLPRTSLSDLFYPGGLTAPELAYAYAIWKFAHQFLNSFNDEEVLTLNTSLSTQENAHLKGVFSKMRQSIKRDVMTEDRVKDVVYDYLDIIKLLFVNFDKSFNPKGEKVRYNKEDDDHLISIIKKSATSDLDFRILNSFRIFNRALLKTNFYKSTKVALSFKLDPTLFLSKLDYPVTPFALFFVVGAEFRGFHCRFVEIARGGIRIIRSANTSSFAINVSTLFDENYNLAFTQQKKNKDIPEGGSKGTILLSLDHQDKSFVAFKKYIDALLDLLLVPSPDVIDYYGKDEILFMGPDEGTAEYMNWASTHARKRGYSFWKSFTTGKSRSLGGIPHDLYGMTTRSIHQFVLGILRKLDLKEEDIKKFQTGGPDGDLGSNEIKISHDKTIAVVDGSGVLYDPNGIDRTELVRLANLRQMTNHFDKSKLGVGGFFVDINDIDVTLPNGEYIEKGLIFRNNFHLEGALLNMVDLFVPCGGRPAAVNISNVSLLFDSDTKKPRFKYIVEGANLFFTQEARLQLESWGVILFKDASANKGGVTSSSLEVLAALALSDDEFKTHMQVTDDANPPPFYTQYVLEVQRIIEEHARDEFECLWHESLPSSSSPPTPRCELTDILSEKINTLNDQISKSKLWDNDSLKKQVITLAIPRNLVELLGIETIMKRVPETYLKAIFGAYLASRFVYTRGLHAGEFGFFEFMTEFLN